MNVILFFRASQISCSPDSTLTNPIPGTVPHLEGQLQHMREDNSARILMPACGKDSLGCSEKIRLSPPEKPKCRRLTLSLCPLCHACTPQHVPLHSPYTQTSQQFFTNYSPLPGPCYSTFFNNITCVLMIDRTKGQRMQKHQGSHLLVVL